MAHHDSSTASDLSNREYALIIEKVVFQADALLVNLDVEKLTPTEVVILHHAYIQNKPIMAVGLRIWEPVIEEMLSNRINDLERAVKAYSNPLNAHKWRPKRLSCSTSLTTINITRIEKLKSWISESKTI